MTIKMKWGMICSVASEQSLDALREFGEWLTETLEQQAGKWRLTHCFERHAEFIVRCTPSDEASVADAYRFLRQRHPSVMYVIHVLPHANSKEFSALRKLSAESAVIAQGILVEKALARFEGADITAVMGNLNQFISQRLAQLVSRHRDDNTYRLHVRQNATLRDDRRMDFSDEVGKVLHAGQTTAPNTFGRGRENNADCFVSVSGYPSHFEKTQVANIFARFFPRSVQWAADGAALVEFDNWIQSAQAVALFHGKPFRSGQLQVAACHEEVASVAQSLTSPEINPLVSDSAPSDNKENECAPINDKLATLSLAKKIDDPSADDSDGERNSEDDSDDGSDTTVVEVVLK